VFNPDPGADFLLSSLETATCRDSVEFMIFCFAKPEDAEGFAERFRGERLPSIQR
jgi:hypothetical protein